MKMQTFKEVAGPHSYDYVARQLAGLVQFSVVTSHRQNVESGNYLMHIGDGADGEENHCVAVALRDGAAFHVLATERGEPFLVHPPA